MSELSETILRSRDALLAQTTVERGEAERYVEEVIDVVRRTLGRPVRTGTRT